MTNNDDAARRAQEYADQAAKTAAGLKAGSWESVQALATLSIAQSLVANAQD
jgi:hypothetical protein